MIATYVATAVAGVVLFVVFLVVRIKGPSITATILKSFTSLLFILTCLAATSVSDHEGFGLLVVAGLVMGLLGDIWLDLKIIYPHDADTWTLLGFAVFFVGHVFYLAAAGSVAGVHVEAVVAGIVGIVLVAAVVILGEKPMGLHYGKFKAVSLVYGALLFFMAAYTLASALLVGDMGLLVMGVGALSFLASDLVLSNTYFGLDRDGPAWTVANYVLYYLGQYLIALSVLWVGVGF